MKKISRRNSIFFIAVSVIMMTGCLFVQRSFSSTTNGTIDTVDRYAWSENAGWVDFGGLGDVHVTDSVLTGYAYSENVGWISLNCSNTDSCTTVDYGVANDGSGDLSGYAWSENAGWIDFSAATINSDGEFTGYAYSENVGWISLNCSNTDTCLTVDYKVKTDYRPQDQRPACDNGRDDDGDGLIDYPNDRGCSDLNDNNEVDPSLAFIPPAKPNISDTDVTVTQDGLLSFTNLPDNIIQIAVSVMPGFEDASWEDISQKEDILKRYDNAPKLYIKFRTKNGAVSDVIVYERNADADNSPQVINDGDIVKTVNNPDVYIIKLKNNKQYKRLILSPSVFKSYGHLKWSNLKIISQSELDSYATSNLVKETKDSIIYELYANGDKGERKMLNAGKLYDADSVYEINAVDRDSYILVK